MLRKVTFQGVFALDEEGALKMVDSFENPNELDDSLKESPGTWVVLPVVEYQEIEPADQVRQINGAGARPATSAGGKKPGKARRIGQASKEDLTE